jgi:F-box/WD-40 domain protein MET30
MPPSRYVCAPVICCNQVFSSGAEANGFETGNIETGEEIRTLTGHTGGIRALQFDDSKLISGSLDSELDLGDKG